MRESEIKVLQMKVDNVFTQLYPENIIDPQSIDFYEKVRLIIEKIDLPVEDNKNDM